MAKGLQSLIQLTLVHAMIPRHHVHEACWEALMLGRSRIGALVGCSTIADRQEGPKGPRERDESNFNLTIGCFIRDSRLS